LNWSANPELALAPGPIPQAIHKAKTLIAYRHALMLISPFCLFCSQSA
jgi:hypothetical protein